MKLVHPIDEDDLTDHQDAILGQLSKLNPEVYEQKYTTPVYLQQQMPPPGINKPGPMPKPGPKQPAAPHKATAPEEEKSSFTD